MQTLFNYIPYLAAPFLFPGISASSRLPAFILLGVVAGIHLYHEILRSHEAEKGGFFEFIFLFSLLGVGLLGFSIQDSWSFHLHWTAMFTGALLLYCLSHSHIPAWKGWLLTVAVTWVILLLHPVMLFMFPFEWFSPTIRETYPWIYHFSEFSAVNLQAIIPPKSHTFSLLYHNSVIWTTVTLITLKYTHPSPPIRFAAIVMICLWFFLLIFICGSAFFLLLGTTFFFFSLFTHWPISLRRGLVTTALLLLCLALYYFKLFPLHIYAQVLLPFLHYMDVNFIFFPWINAPHSGIDDWGLLSANPNTLALGFLLLPLLILTLFSFKKEPDPISARPASLTVIFLLALAHGKTPLALFANPFFWLAFAPFLSHKTISLPHFFHSMVIFLRRAFPYVIATLFIILSIPASSNLFHDWKAEMHLQGFSSTKRLQKRANHAKAAYHSAPYRGDTSALFATALLDLLIQNKALPTQNTEEDILQSLNTSSHYNYAPIMAYKRLSDLYFIHAHSARSIEILEQATQNFPNIPVLHEMLAERLVVLGQRKKAIDVYQHCVNLDPTEPRTRHKLIVLYQNLGMKEEENSERHKLAILNPFWNPEKKAP